MNWNTLLQDLESINQNTILNAIPHQYNGDSAGLSVVECMNWINDENQDSLDPELVPIYGGSEEGGYEGSARFLLINIVTGKFYEISGYHCSCYGFEGQFTPSECPIEYLAKGKYWAEAYPTVLEVVKYFVNNPIN